MPSPLPLKICFLLESCALSGGVRVVLDLARALQARGHEAIVLSRRGQPDWYPHPVAIQHADDLAHHGRALNADVVVATFWTTLRPALACGARHTLHFCQGCEWENIEYAEIDGQIAAAYATPVPTLTVGPWLGPKITRKTGKPATLIHTLGQCVDTQTYHPLPAFQRLLRTLRPRRAPSLLIPGIAQATVKGIRDALQAVALLRQQGMALEVVRVSAMDPMEDEARLTPIDRYFQAIPTAQMAQLYREADLVVVPSLEGEGFGLPFVEALASGTPALASDISSFRSIAAQLSAEDLLFPAGNPEALSGALRAALSHLPRHRSATRHFRRQIIARFAPAAVARRFEDIVASLPSP
ncbi:MAG TPA: glycosyltransferase family 4 protein [Myxococcota bacterium]|nr:glycosyltransferase family 4 protein [Myxococcota bacterium]